MRMRRFRKKLSILTASHPGLERKALRFFHSMEEVKQFLEKYDWKKPVKPEKMKKSLK